ncbi:RNA polymerase sigma factor [Fulvivirga maritima]|uniref:RNA polymerase sigma factor n=1 Tax=Fulvivirga maritima TaxID=2904247 RepID=UPI001F477434|nr:RNA polymerase sigma factor [Fulvivirga maritima]UII24962.1 RNA polymerase sigma factor [Fulvivirga maritima]
MSDKKKTEEEIIRMCRKNNRSGQKLLFDKYAKAMFNVAYRISNDYELANDILQEGFMEVFKNIKSFRAESALGAWIKTIIVRTTLRKVKKEGFFESFELEKHDQVIEWSDHFTVQDLEKAIQSLPDGYRAVFLLSEKEGYKHREIAEMLEISEGTSKSQLWNAKKILQKKLKEYQYDRI